MMRFRGSENHSAQMDEKCGDNELGVIGGSSEDRREFVAGRTWRCTDEKEIGKKKNI